MAYQHALAVSNAARCRTGCVRLGQAIQSAVSAMEDL